MAYGDPAASWFETRGVAALLTMRLGALIPESLTENASSIFSLSLVTENESVFSSWPGLSRPSTSFSLK
jgi:hypothetical protein